MQVSTMARARDRVCSGPTSSSGSPGCRACPPVTAASPPRQAHVAVRLAAGGRSVACKCAGGGLAASMCPVARVCRGLPGRCLAPIQPEAWAGSRCGSQASAGRTAEGSGERLRRWKLGRSAGLRGSRAFSEAQAARWEPRSVAPAAPAVRLLWAVPVFPPGSSRLRTSQPCWSGESRIRDGTSVQRHKVWGSGCPPGSFQPGRRLPLLSSACCGWVAAGKSKPSSSPFSVVIPRRFVPLCCWSFVSGLKSSPRAGLPLLFICSFHG